jgi:phosphoenolpyruvate carboxylase
LLPSPLLPPRSQVQGAWRTDEIRRRKQSPQDESREGLTYFHETIYSGLPVFLRRIDTALKNIGQPMLPLEAKLFSFGGWVGGWVGGRVGGWVVMVVGAALVAAQ